MCELPTQWQWHSSSFTDGIELHEIHGPVADERYFPQDSFVVMLSKKKHQERHHV
jgi:hypothetical protein